MLDSRTRLLPVSLAIAAALGILGTSVLRAQAPPAPAAAPKAAPPRRPPLPRRRRPLPRRSRPPRSPDPADPVDGGWPREVKTTAGVVTVYQPQIDAWDGSRLAVYAAVSVKEKEDAAPFYGVVWADGRTVVDKESRLVTFTDREFKKAVFPSQPGKNAAMLEVLRKEVAPVTRTLALDRLTAMLELSEMDKAARTAELGHTPPRIVFSTTSAILVYVDGEPAWRPLKDTKLERAINTRLLLVRRGDELYLHVFDGWMTAKDLSGPWKVEKKESKDLKAAEADAKASGQVDLLPGGNPSDAKTLPSLKQEGRVPRIVVATTPTELFVTEGEPVFAPIAGTGLTYVKNTTGNLLRDTADQKLYLLVSGRWFRAATQEGPWEYVANDALPAEFAKIPDDSEKENVKAAVAGTPQAKEALVVEPHPADRRGEGRGREDRPAEVRRGAEARRDRRNAPALRGQHRDPRDPGEPDVLVRRRQRRLVHRGVPRAGRGPWPPRCRRSSTPSRRPRPSTT